MIKFQQPAIKALSLKLRNTYDILQNYNETDEEEVEENNGRTLRMHTKKQLKKYWGTKGKGKNHQQRVVGASSREKTTEEQHRAEKVRQD